MPSIASSTPATNIMPKNFYYVSVKSDWSGSWNFVQYLTPITSSEQIAPNISQADFVYNFGNILREGQGSVAAFTPLDLKDKYIKIETQYAGNPPVDNWYGIVVDQQISVDSPTDSTGVMQVKAYGLAHILDRIHLHKGFVETEDSSVEVGWLPTFNEQNKRGRSILGNRSDTQYGSPNAAYVFAQTFDGSLAERWSNKDILEYLCVNYSPPPFNLVLTGQVDPLDDIYDIHHLEGMTLWQALNKLIDRRKGFGFRLDTTGEDDVNIEVFSLTDAAISVGSFTLPANANPVSFTMPTSYPFTHLLDSVPFTITGSNQYDKAIIRGQRMKVMASFSYEDKTLTEGWEDTDESDYNDAASDPKNAEKNDDFRACSEKFEKVFLWHIVPDDWDWQAGDGEGGSKVSVSLLAKDDGTVEQQDPTNPPLYYWNGQKTFERALPLHVGVDYTASQDPEEWKSDREFRAMFCLVQYNGKYYYSEKLSHLKDQLSNFSVRPLDDRFGIALSASPNHAIGKNHFDDSNAPSTVEARIDYEDIVVTAFFETDQRQQITINALTTNPHETERTLYVDVDGAEYWFAATNCVINATTSGQLERIASGNKVLRDDKEKLEAVAAFIQAWYSVKRQAVKIPIKEIGMFVNLGSMLTNIVGVWFNEPINTVVSGRSIDYRAGSTTIETGYVALDEGVNDLFRDGAVNNKFFKVSQRQANYAGEIKGGLSAEEAASLRQALGIE